MTSLQHSIIGLPGSGKTTFLAALWHLLDAGEVSSKFVLDKLVGDHTHLNMIVDAWRRCEEVPRTSMAAEAKVSIHVRETATEQTAVLHFPDLSGESFERQLSTRSCTCEYVEGFEGSGGILLFVTADRSSDGMAILDVSSVIPGEDVLEQLEDHREWAPEMVSMQVNLVDLLQFLQYLPFRRGIRRVAVIVSAWDVVETPDLEPAHWLERELPLLYQFLISNPNSFEFQVYGVSAQGGDVKSDHKSELILKTPSTRISCIGPETDPHDLTSPIVWLMSSD
jgi:hypothetical protein